MRKNNVVTLIIIFLSLVITDVVFAQDSNTDESTSGEIASLLVPLVAAAAAIERVIEMIFDYYEGSILSLSKTSKLGSDYAQWAQGILVEAHRKLVKPPKTGNEPKEEKPKEEKPIEELEKELADAKSRLSEYLESDYYTSWKRARALSLGLAFGVVLAIVGKIQMFSFLNISIPQQLAWIDMLITGLVIGTGSAPVHSLIGILQKSKDAIDEARGLLKGKAVSQIADLLKSTINTEVEVTPEPKVGDAQKTEPEKTDRTEETKGTVKVETPAEEKMKKRRISDVELQRIAERMLK